MDGKNCSRERCDQALHEVSFENGNIPFCIKTNFWSRKSKIRPMCIEFAQHKWSFRGGGSPKLAGAILSVCLRSKDVRQGCLGSGKQTFRFDSTNKKLSWKVFWRCRNLFFKKGSDKKGEIPYCPTSNPGYCPS